MCVNQIFKDEQLAMMRFARATNAGEIATCEGQFAHFKTRFASLPYPHRPFFGTSGTKVLSQAAGTRSVALVLETSSMQGVA